MVGSTFVTDVEVTDYLNNGIAELHDILVTKYEDYSLKSAEFELVGGVDNEFDLPSDFYKVLGVDYQTNSLSTTVVNLRSYHFGERNMYNNLFYNTGIVATPRYHVQGSKLKFIPKPSTSGTATLFYVPEAQKLSTTQTEDTLANIPNGYEEYAVICAAINCLQKEESDVRVHLAQKRELKERIETAATYRNAGDPTYAVRDVSIGVDEMFFV
tara:strand:- start:503 stop:1141 length:639 start_codon:yes stop_codon:yes gene_type:complete